MASFDKYAPRLRKWEGNKFVDNPYDYGGATNSGVTIQTFRLVFGQDKTVDDLRRMTQEQWRKVMKGYFWDQCWGDMIKNQSVAEIFVDWCINSGIGKIKMVQEMVGTTPDGIVGPKTIAAINDGINDKNGKGSVLHRKIKLARANRFMNQINASPSTQFGFFNGWFNRLIDFNYVRE